MGIFFRRKYGGHGTCHDFTYEKLHNVEAIDFIYLYIRI